jgi:type VI secretion system secreted protein Hcp
MKHCASGKHLPKVELSTCKAGGTQVEYSKVTLEEVLVTSVQIAAEKDSEAVVVNYAFQAAKIKQQDWEQTDNGGKGAESLVAWDIKQNKEV